ncbi:MAG: aminotransferase class I/II-fold pyridoxal phosphate-dependent enzyme [Pseudomonadota bacterium]
MKKLSQFSPIPEIGVKKALELMESGALYRYCSTNPEESEVALFEKDIAEYVGSNFALAVNSCGSAMYIALRSLGVKPGDPVLTSAFTYTAVPSAIVNAGAIPVLVDCTEDYGVDTEDLKRKITPKTKVLLLSHMRGHLSDMETVTNICEEHGITLMEDCAHSLGSKYDGVHTGLFGKAGCFSTQTHKIINAGEGGFLITNDEEIFAKGVLYAGSQEKFWQKHFFQSQYLERYQEYIPNISMRMSNLAAAILRPQLHLVDEWIETYQQNYKMLVNIVSQSDYLYIPRTDSRVRRGADTFQFNLKKVTAEQRDRFLSLLAQQGIPVKTFGYEGSPRFFKSWKYIDGIENIHLPQAERILPFACDMRLPLSLTSNDIQTIGSTLLKTIQEVTQ